MQTAIKCTIAAAATALTTHTHSLNLLLIILFTFEAGYLSRHYTVKHEIQHFVCAHTIRSNEK